jgi:hypothetical protein
MAHQKTESNRRPRCNVKKSEKPGEVILAFHFFCNNDRDFPKNAVKDLQEKTKKIEKFASKIELDAIPGPGVHHSLNKCLHVINIKFNATSLISAEGLRDWVGELKEKKIISENDADKALGHFKVEINKLRQQNAPGSREELKRRVY